jgi:prepilin-type N-terminal cleavage/methylation domain-containing protein
MDMYYKNKKAFTLIEVLISIALLGIVIVALFSTVAMMRDSNAHLYKYLQKAKIVTKSTKVLYSDILNSDGNITIKKDEFTRLCMEETRNSFYALSLAKVCWVVLKKDNTLARIEGNTYSLPTRFDDRVEVNPIMKHIEIFDVYHEKDKVLVFLKQKGKTPISFLIQGVTKPRKKVISKTKNKPNNKNKNSNINDNKGKIGEKPIGGVNGERPIEPPPPASLNSGEIAQKR